VYGRLNYRQPNFAR